MESGRQMGQTILAVGDGGWNRVRVRGLETMAVETLTWHPPHHGPPRGGGSGDPSWEGLGNLKRNLLAAQGEGKKYKRQNVEVPREIAYEAVQREGLALERDKGAGLYKW